MIQEFVDRFIPEKDGLIQKYTLTEPDCYDDLVKDVVEIITSEEKYSDPDPDRITVIDHGDYQGDRLFIIAGKGYQPDNYWYVSVAYGSCGGCDTFEAIGDYGRDSAIQKANDYWTLALHILQDMKKLEE